MKPYDRLINILDAFIDTVEGSIDDSFRVRGIQTAMLLERATASGSGIRISELARHSEAPLENVRRHIQAQVELGNLRSSPDPQDDRSSLIFVTEQGSQLYDTLELVRRLGSLEGDTAAQDFEGEPPYDEIIAILLSFMEGYPGGMKVQGVKRELLIQRATDEGQGLTVSDLARLTDTPLETVRRHVQNAIEQGELRLLEDPDDERKTRVVHADPGRESQRAETVNDHLSRVDWTRFHSGERGEGEAL